METKTADNRSAATGTCKSTNWKMTLDNLISRMDYIIPNYIQNYTYRLGGNTLICFDQIKCKAVMASELWPEFEMCVDLCNDALNSMLRTIGPRQYPHFKSLQSLLNYIFNHEHPDLGLATEVLSRMLSTHPVYRENMMEYYQHIIEDCYAQIGGTKEDQPFILVLLDLLLQIPTPWPNDFAYLIPEKEPVVDIAFESLTQKKQSRPSFLNLSVEERLTRITVCLNFICDILQMDLVDWLLQPSKGRLRKPLLANFIWPNKQQEGLISSTILKILGVQLCGPNVHPASVACQRLLALTAEYGREQGRKENNRYPFFGPFSTDLARALGSILLKEIEVNENRVTEFLTRLKPPWLRLLTSCQVLGHLAGFQCPPDLTSVITVFEYLEVLYKIGRSRKMHQENKPTLEADASIVAKFAKLKSVNATFRSGLTRLHTACRENNVEAVRALLTFPSLDLNLKCPSGWTALHEAAARGNSDCIRELLQYQPAVGLIQRRVDTRACGQSNYTPLMRAVENGKAEVCALLLKHSGSVLLEDINENGQTAIDLCQNEQVLSVLLKYKKVWVETIFSRREMNFATGNLVLVAQICSILVQSYLGVHRTWQVYHALKKCTDEGIDLRDKPKILCEYTRYHRDFRTNLQKLRQTVNNLRKVKDLADTIEILMFFVSMNKDHSFFS